MFRFFYLFKNGVTATLLVLLFAGSALADPGVRVSVKVKGDYLHIDTLTKTPLPEPKLRMNPSPKFLELSFPRTFLDSKPFTKAVDKGLIQKVQSLEKAKTTHTRIFFVTKPKTKLSKIEGGYRYTVHLNEMASATTKPAAKVSAKPKTPVKVLTNKPSGQRPVKVLTNKPAGKTPKVAAKPRTVSTSKKVTTPVTVVFQNTPLPQAIKTLAKKAGMVANVDPSLTGSVNLSLSAIPFHEAMKLLLDPLGDSVQTRVSGKTVFVSRVAKTVTKTKPQGPTVVEYYPLKKKDAEKMLQAVRKAVPELTYQVDTDLNVILAEGSAVDIEKLSQILQHMSKK